MDTGATGLGKGAGIYAFWQRVAVHVEVVFKVVEGAGYQKRSTLMPLTVGRESMKSVAVRFLSFRRV